MGEKEASGKPPHSFLPNLQPGRVSPAARREQVLAGPLTRASTPQSRSQVSGNPLNLPSESQDSWDFGPMHRKSCCRDDKHYCSGEGKASRRAAGCSRLFGAWCRYHMFHYHEVSKSPCPDSNQV